MSNYSPQHAATVITDASCNCHRQYSLAANSDGDLTEQARLEMVRIIEQDVRETSLELNKSELDPRVMKASRVYLATNSSQQMKSKMPMKTVLCQLVMGRPYHSHILSQ